MNNLKIAAALRVLADAFETPAEVPPQQPGAGVTPEPQKRGRGRPVKGEDLAPARSAQASDTSTTTQTPAVADADPFAAAPVGTLEGVRAALTNLKNASTQEIALGVLKDTGGAANITELKPDKYGAVIVAAEKKTAEYTKAPDPTPEADPFEVAATPAVKLTIEDVKAAVVAATKRTATDTVQKIVMKHGGKAPLSTGGEGPSLKALPESAYAAVIKETQDLPTTK